MKRPGICWSTPRAGILALQLALIIYATNVATLESEEIRRISGIQYRAYGGGPSFPIPTLPDTLWSSELITRNADIRHISADTTEVKSEARSAKRNRPHQVDESMVADMLKNPDAMKMVLKYLTKQNLYEHQKKWNQMSNSKKNGKNKWKKKNAKKRTTTTAKPTRRPPPTPPRTTRKRANLKTTSKSAVIKSDRRKDDIGGSDGKEKEKKKKRRPSGGNFFDLAQLFASFSGPPGNHKKAKKSGVKEKSQPADLSFLFGPPPKRRPTINQRPSQRPTPPSNFDKANNPQLMGDKPKLQYFGPSDFVPQHPYALPMQQHGPMKLTYMSAKEFPNIPKYGLIPIPRRR